MRLATTLTLVFLFVSSSHVTGDQSVEALVKTLQTGDDDAKYQALVALADLGPKAEAGIPDLIAAMQLKNEDLRLNAAIALSKIGKAAVPAVVRLLDAKDEDTRYHAISVIGWIGPDAVDTAPAIIKAMGDKSGDIRRKAIYALGNMQPKKELVLPHLIEALGDSDEDVGAAAVEAVSKFGEAAVPQLIGKLKEKQGLQSIRALRAVAWIGPPAKDAVPQLMVWLSDPLDADSTKSGFRWR